MKEALTFDLEKTYGDFKIRAQGSFLGSSTPGKDPWALFPLDTGRLAAKVTQSG